MRLVVIDLSSSPYVDVAAADMLAECHEELAGRGITLQVSNMTGEVRDLMRRDGLDKVFGDLGPADTGRNDDRGGGDRGGSRGGRRRSGRR